MPEGRRFFGQCNFLALIHRAKPFYLLYVLYSFLAFGLKKRCRNALSRARLGTDSERHRVQIPSQAGTDSEQRGTDSERYPHIHRHLRFSACLRTVRLKLDKLQSLSCISWVQVLNLYLYPILSSGTNSEQLTPNALKALPTFWEY